MSPKLLKVSPTFKMWFWCKDIKKLIRMEQEFMEDMWVSGCDPPQFSIIGHLLIACGQTDSGITTRQGSLCCTHHSDIRAPPECLWNMVWCIPLFWGEMWGSLEKTQETIKVHDGFHSLATWRSNKKYSALEVLSFSVFSMGEEGTWTMVLLLSEEFYFCEQTPWPWQHLY